MSFSVSDARAFILWRGGGYTMSTKKKGAQLTMPGTQHLQPAYLVIRDGEEVLVPLERLTREEIDEIVARVRRQAAEYERQAEEYRRILDAAACT